MVEEFMLLANCSVAQRILDEFPDCALLRRHPAPGLSNFDPLIKAGLSKVCNNVSLLLEGSFFYMINLIS